VKRLKIKYRDRQQDFEIN